jgi:hypothetical protein
LTELGFLLNKKCIYNTGLIKARIVDLPNVPAFGTSFLKHIGKHKVE